MGEQLGSVQWFKEKKHVLFRHARALDAFSVARAAIATIKDGAEQGDDPTNEISSALFMKVVIAYSRPFLSSNARYGKKHSYPPRFLKTHPQFDSSIHTYLIELRNKLIAHDDYIELPPTLGVYTFNIRRDEQEDTKPIALMMRSYSFNSVRGTSFLQKVSDHLTACVEAANAHLRKGMAEYLSEAQAHPDNHNGSGEEKTVPKRFGEFSVQGSETTKLFELEELETSMVTLPKGKTHKNEHEYRMLTYVVAAPETEFELKDPVWVHLSNRDPKRPEKHGVRWPPRLHAAVARSVEWLRAPLFSKAERDFT